MPLRSALPQYYRTVRSNMVAKTPHHSDTLGVRPKNRSGLGLFGARGGARTYDLLIKSHGPISSWQIPLLCGFPGLLHATLTERSASVADPVLTS